jgi:hypothetical protein
MKSCTASQAYREWETEIVEGVWFICQLAKELGLKHVQTPGLAYHARVPKRGTAYINQPRDRHTWSFTGRVERDYYLLTVWPHGHTVHLSRIKGIYEERGVNAVFFQDKRETTQDRFIEADLSVDNNFEWQNKWDSATVAIVFSTTNRIPDEQLGNCFLGSDEEKEQDSDATTQKGNFEESWDDDWDEHKEETTKEVEVEIETDEQPSAYDKVISYSENEKFIDIIRRVESWLPELRTEDLIVVVKELVTGGDCEPEDLIAAQNSDELDDYEIKQLLMKLARLHPHEAFAEVWMMSPHRNYCSKCFEPLYAQLKECTECGTRIGWDKQ